MIGRFDVAHGVFIDTASNGISIRFGSKLWDAHAKDFKKVFLAAKEKIGYADDMELFEGFSYPEDNLPQYVVDAIRRLPQNPFANNELRKYYLSMLDKVGVANGKKLIRRGADRRLKHRVIARDRSKCRYCEDPVNKKLPLDHVVPYSLGGKTEYDNLVVICIQCNSRKGGRTPEQAGMILRPVKN